MKFFLLIGLSVAALHSSHVLGETVAKRLISTDAVVTEVLTLLNADHQLVAVDFSSEMPANRSLPRLGYHRALAAEGLIALGPDLIIGSETMGPPHVLSSLERAEIPVMQLPTADSLVVLRNNIQQIAEAVGRTDAAESMLLELDRAASRIKHSPYLGQSAAFLLRGEGGKLRLAGGDTAGSGFLSLLGADNVVNHQGYRSVTPEGLLELRPDLLVLADTRDMGSADLMAEHPLLRFSKAVRAEHFFIVDPATLVAGLSPSAILEAQRIIEGNSEQALTHIESRGR